MVPSSLVRCVTPGAHGAKTRPVTPSFRATARVPEAFNIRGRVETEKQSEGLQLLEYHYLSYKD